MSARIIQFPPVAKPPPPDPEQAYLAACGAFLKSCFAGEALQDIRREAAEMRRKHRAWRNSKEKIKSRK